jgi:hypothetical protein
MDPNRLKEAFLRLEALDQRLTHKVRPRASTSMVSPSSEQMETRLRDLADYTVELKEIVRELLLAFARPAGPKSDA